MHSDNRVDYIHQLQYNANAQDEGQDYDFYQARTPFLDSFSLEWTRLVFLLSLGIKALIQLVELRLVGILSFTLA